MVSIFVESACRLVFSFFFSFPHALYLVLRCLFLSPFSFTLTPPLICSFALFYICLYSPHFSFFLFQFPYLCISIPETSIRFSWPSFHCCTLRETRTPRERLDPERESSAVEFLFIEASLSSLDVLCLRTISD